MNEQQIQNFIIDAIRQILSAGGAPPPIAIDADTVIFGDGGLLDSMALVELMLALEDYCGQRGMPFIWENDAAMSHKRSVYHTPATLAKHIAHSGNTSDGR